MTRSRILFTLAAAAVFASIGYRSSFLLRPRYLGEVRLTLSRQSLPAKYAAASDVMIERLPVWVRQLTSAERLEHLITSEVLPVSARFDGEPMERLVERARNDVRIERSGSADVIVHVIAEEPERASKAAQWLAEILIGESDRDRQTLADTTVQALRREVVTLARLVDTRSADLVERRRRGEHLPSLELLDLETMEDRFRVLQLRVADAETLSNLLRYGPVGSFWISRPAAVPTHPLSPPRALFALGGGIAGGLVAVIAQRVRRRPEPSGVTPPQLAEL